MNLRESGVVQMVCVAAIRIELVCVARQIEGKEEISSGQVI